MTTLEQVIATVQTLPPADRRQLQLFLQEGLPAQARRDEAAKQPPAVPSTNGAHPAETVEQQIARFNKAMNWIREHRAEYLGQWVALEGDQLVSHGTDALQAHQAAKAAGIAAPFLERVVEQAEGPYWGGWL